MARKDQKDLPGMEDRELKDLAEAAVAYAELRDERMDLNRREAESKADLLALMRKHKKKVYDHDGVSVEIVAEKETLKVKIFKSDVEGEEESEAA